MFTILYFTVLYVTLIKTKTLLLTVLHCAIVTVPLMLIGHQGCGNIEPIALLTYSLLSCS